jgi:3-oxoacyl-[acyl-carrier-protein] synthase III
VAQGERAESVFLLGAAAAVPERRMRVGDILRDEAERHAQQLAALSPQLRSRIDESLGIEAVRAHDGKPSELALRAARDALAQAGVDPTRLRLVVDYSTLPGDQPGVWSLANQIQAALECPEAIALSTSGSGCAGLHLALRTACALMRAERDLDLALLVAADCVGATGRCCLPVSILGDAASAVVLSRKAPVGRRAPRILSVATSTLGAFHAVIHLGGSPPRNQIDGHAFESKILPVHFVMSQRVLDRALGQAGQAREQVRHLVYPNTSDLDRDSVRRALGIGPERLSGPGPRELGHGFASDMVINLPPTTGDPNQWTALLAVGSGFTWGACIVG